jgi:carbamoyltransferase
VRGREIVAAAQEERFTRKKGDASFPEHAVEYCLAHAGIEASDLAYVGFYDKPLLKFERILETYLGVVPRGLRSFLMAGPLDESTSPRTSRAAGGSTQVDLDSPSTSSAG